MISVPVTMNIISHYMDHFILNFEAKVENVEVKAKNFENADA